MYDRVGRMGSSEVPRDPILSSLSISLIDHEIQVDEWEQYPLKECPHIETQEEVQDHWTPTEVKERKDEDPPTWKRTAMELHGWNNGKEGNQSSSLGRKTLKIRGRVLSSKEGMMQIGRAHV